MMKHSGFEIGTRFSVGEEAWFCTDVGSRVIVAVCLGSDRRENGLGYVDECGDSVEEVFNENDMLGCYAFGEDNPEPSWVRKY